MVNTFNKSDAVDFAHNVKMIMDALVAEGFDESEARNFTENLFIAMFSCR